MKPTDRDPDVKKLQTLRAKLAEGVHNGTFTAASALSYLQKQADALVRAREKKTVRIIRR